MTLEDAIKTALKYENKVRDLYTDAQKKAKDDVGKRIFKILADEEQDHVDYLESRLEVLKQTGKVTADDLDTKIPTKKEIEKGVKTLKKTMKGEGSGQLDLLQKALAAEVETSNFYKKMVSELDADGKAFFGRFVEIEEGHVAIVQAEIDSVTGLGYWFDFQEFNLEAG